MPAADPPPLLGRYAAPPLKPGARVYCHYRQTRCRVTSWTDAPIPWPRVNAVGARGGSGLLVNDELIRAVRPESAAALKHWFGVSTHVAWRWRKRFVPGTGNVRTEGDAAAHRKASEAGAAATRGVPLSDAVCDARSERAKRQGRRPPPRTDHLWTADQLALLGTMDDDELAARLGKSAAAVRSRRRDRGIPRPRDHRRRENR